MITFVNFVETDQEFQFVVSAQQFRVQQPADPPILPITGRTDAFDYFLTFFNTFSILCEEFLINFCVRMQFKRFYTKSPKTVQNILVLFQNYFIFV